MARRRVVAASHDQIRGIRKQGHGDSDRGGGLLNKRSLGLEPRTLNEGDGTNGIKIWNRWIVTTMGMRTCPRAVISIIFAGHQITKFAHW